MHTLTNGATTVTLPPHLLWVDEFAWQAVEQRVRYSITGALLLETAAKQAGQPITLQGGASFAWVDRGSLLTLQSWATQPGLVMQLVLRDATAVDVVFDHARMPLEATPVVDYADPVTDDPYALTLRFLKV